MNSSYTWVCEENGHHYTEEGQTASGFGDFPKGSHQPDWIIAKAKDGWHAKSRTSAGWVGPFATVGKAKRRIEQGMGR